MVTPGGCSSHISLLWSGIPQRWGAKTLLTEQPPACDHLHSSHQRTCFALEVHRTPRRQLYGWARGGDEPETHCRHPNTWLRSCCPRSLFAVSRGRAPASAEPDEASEESGNRILGGCLFWWCPPGHFPARTSPWTGWWHNGIRFLLKGSSLGSGFCRPHPWRWRKTRSPNYSWSWYGKRGI